MGEIFLSSIFCWRRQDEALALAPCCRAVNGMECPVRGVVELTAVLRSCCDGMSGGSRSSPAPGHALGSPFLLPPYSKNLPSTPQKTHPSTDGLWGGRCHGESDAGSCQRVKAASLRPLLLVLLRSPTLNK